MISTWNIASATRPNNFEAFTEIVKNSARENNSLEVVALIVVKGYGCNNYALMIAGPEKEAEMFIRSVTMVLQPAKYSRVDGDPAIKIGDFRCDI